MACGHVPARDILIEVLANMSKIKCKICRQEYSFLCDYNQGRCPHHPPIIDVACLQQKISKLILNFFKKK
jgi:E3 ubiquitin-protein ligase DOA10